MKITLESTAKIVHLANGGRETGAGGIPCRVWEGKTESGIEIHAFIVRVGVEEGLEPEMYAQFERELVEQRKPSAVVEAIPLRMIL